MSYGADSLYSFYFSLLLFFFSTLGEAKKRRTSKKSRGHRVSRKSKNRPVDVAKILGSKAVSRIHKRQARRMTPIRGYKKEGYIGEKENGFLAIRNIDKLSKREKSKLKKLLNSENRDRKKLYQIISRASKYSKKEEAFLRLNMFRSHLEVAPRGVYYFENGRWQQK